MRTGLATLATQDRDAGGTGPAKAPAPHPPRAYPAPQTTPERWMVPNPIGLCWAVLCQPLLHSAKERHCSFHHTDIWHP